MQLKVLVVSRMGHIVHIKLAKEMGQDDLVTRFAGLSMRKIVIRPRFDNGWIGFA